MVNISPQLHYLTTIISTPVGNVHTNTKSGCQSSRNGVGRSGMTLWDELEEGDWRKARKEAPELFAPEEGRPEEAWRSERKEAVQNAVCEEVTWK